MAPRFPADRLRTTYEEPATGRFARLATGLWLRLTGARRPLATGAPGEAAARYRALRDEAERLGLESERAEALTGLGECALAGGELGEVRERFEATVCLPAAEPASPAPCAAWPRLSPDPPSATRDRGTGVHRPAGART
ncbi:hypothetical protein ABZ079_04690 [Streptomyces sp. NPDC006314]|uniref:hypothetical protein n=1 Tax=Streptomyces sp. NPDC006314 TaxID=3154475 RepID=UPI0033ADA175